MMRLRTFYSTIVLSDIHLGTSHSKTTEVTNLTGYGGHLRAGQSR